MSDDLPEFRKMPYIKAHSYISRVLNKGGKQALVSLIGHDDNHFRAIFDRSYFVLADDDGEPSRSQWSTLKKHMKRINRSVFVFKRHGETEDGHYYVDFGFFLD